MINNNAQERFEEAMGCLLHRIDNVGLILECWISERSQIWPSQHT
jgi:hypothetical protein